MKLLRKVLATALLALTATAAFAQPVSSTNFYTKANQGATTATWNAMWTNNGAIATGVAPVAGNEYEAIGNGVAFGANVLNTRLRNLSAGTLQTFPGDKLTLSTNAEFRFKNPGLQLNFPGINGQPGLVMKGGALNAGDDSVYEIQGRVRVVAPSILTPADQGAGALKPLRGFKLSAALEGSGGLYLIQGSTTIPALEVTGLNNPYTGTWYIKCGLFRATSVGSLGTGNIIIDPALTVPTTLVNATLTAGPAQFEVMYDHTSTGTLTIANGGTMNLHQNLTFSSISINGTSLSIGTHPFAELNASFSGVFASGSGSLTVQPLLPVPLGVTAIGTNAAVNLSWSAALGATNYIVKRSTVNGSGHVAIGTTTGTTFSDTTVVNGSTYYYVIVAQHPGGDSGNSSQASALPVAPPAAPATLSASPGNTVVNLAWSASVNASSYLVKRSLTSGGPYAVIATNSAAAIIYADATVANGTAYFYVVSALNAGGTSTDSSEASAVPDNAPTGLTALGGNLQVTLNWDDFSGATAYLVKRGITNGGPYVTIATGVLASDYVDTAVISGQTYFYVVSAIAGTESANSAQATVSTIPAVPTAVVAVSPATGRQVNLSWAQADPVITTFKIEQSTDGVNFTQVATTPGSARSTVIGNLAFSTNFYFRVIASNAGGDSAVSASANATTPAFNAFVNFAATTFATNYPGYMNDYGTVFADRGNGYSYGWDADNTANSRERNSGLSPDKRYDTFNHIQKQVPARIWEIAVPSGFYRVRIVAGDPTAVDSLFQFNVESSTSSSYSPLAPNYWGDFTVETYATDGRITITSSLIATNSKINFVDITTQIPLPPVLGAQPQNVTVEEHHSVALSASVSSGSTPLSFQWYQNGSAVLDATNLSLSFSQAASANAGDYYVVASNFVGLATSSVATITVIPDVIVPYVVSHATLDGRTIGIKFSEPMDDRANEVTDTFGYMINGGANGVASVTLRPGSNSVLITLVDPLPVNGAYSIELSAAMGDYAGNKLPASSLVLTGTVAGFFAGDVGAPPLAGSHYTADGNTVTVVGGGADVWGASDQFYVVDKPISGDFDARVRVDSLVGQNTITKGVLVARESNDANAMSLHISVGPLPPGRDLLQSGVRVGTTSNTTQIGVSYVPGGLPNVWMRINRSGNTFTSYRSTNGTDWLLIGSTGVVASSTMQVGFGVTAHDTNLLATGIFSGFLVITPPVITASPTNLVLNSGATASFSVTASSAGTLSYQWRKGGAPITTATNSTYAIIGVSAGDAADYDVVVANSAGASTSAVATLTVNVAPQAPEITDQPDSQSVLPGATVSFSVTATGTGPLGYQWSFGTSALLNETNATLSLTNVQAASAGDYSVVVSNSGGSVTSSVAVLTVVPPTPVTPVFTASGGFALSVQSVVGKTYALEYKDSLADANWTPLTGVPGNGGPVSLSDANAPATRRFYRIRVD